MALPDKLIQEILKRTRSNPAALFKGTRPFPEAVNRVPQSPLRAGAVQGNAFLGRGPSPIGANLNAPPGTFQGSGLTGRVAPGQMPGNLGPYGPARFQKSPGNASNADIAAALQRIDPSMAGGVRGLPRPSTALVPTGGRALIPAPGRDLVPAGNRAMTTGFRDLGPSPNSLLRNTGPAIGATGAAVAGAGSLLNRDSPSTPPAQPNQPASPPNYSPADLAQPPNLNSPRAEPVPLPPVQGLDDIRRPPVPLPRSRPVPLPQSRPAPVPTPTPNPARAPAPVAAAPGAGQPAAPSNQSILNALFRGPVDKYGRRFEPVVEAGNPYRY